ncbi:MAG: CotH kinase family protein, partial [Verrucomicrobiota bacterium]
MYNCGVRYRGGPLGRRVNPHNYHIEFPRRKTLDDLRDMNLNWRRPLLQYVGFSVMKRGGHGVVAPEPKLVRLWMNETESSAVQAGRGFGGVYIRVEEIRNGFLEKRFSTPLGNLYKGKDFGGLDWRPSLEDYQVDSNPPIYPDHRPDYTAWTNNPVTVWRDLDDLCWTLAQPNHQFPMILQNRMNVRQWARYYGIQVALENAEGGIYCSSSCSGDDYYIYGDPANHQFTIIPWDMDNIIDEGRGGWDAVDVERSIWNWEGPWGPYAQNATPIVTNFLFHDPIAPLFVGDVVDVHKTILTPDSMNEIFDEMGSAITPFY